MIIDVTGVTSGSSPYLIYLCDWDLSSCFFITGVTTIPPIVQIDSNYYFPGLQLLKVKIFDKNLKLKNSYNHTPNINSVRSVYDLMEYRDEIFGLSHQLLKIDPNTGECSFP